MPNIISNVTIPMLGMIDIAIAGRLGNDVTIGAIAIGTAIFNFIYWNCAFVRMGTSGLTAQAFGAGNRQECSNLLGRAMVICAGLALLLVILNRPIGNLSLRLMNGSAEATSLAARYFFVRIWAAPAAVGLFGLHGWLIGMQDSKTPMIVSIVNNILNIGFSLWFCFGLDMGIEGIAWGTVIGQYVSLLITLLIIATRYRSYFRAIDLREALNARPLGRFFRINADAFLRTLLVCTVYTFFTAASSRFGDTVLATNELLMQLFMLFSYLSDGFDYAAESLTGRFIGAGDRDALRRTIRALIVWCGVVVLFYVVVYIFLWRAILGLFSSSATILACAADYVVWVILVPLVGFTPFLIDGILIGAAQTRTMRNTTFWAAAAYFALFYLLVGRLGNTALWIAFLGFIVIRFVLMLVATHGLSTDRLMKGAKD